MKHLIATLVVCLFVGSAHAHKDRILTLGPEGSIPELPMEYASARLRIGWPVAQKGVTFNVNGREISVPRCALVDVKSRSMADVRLSGSWYHSSKSGLPHYINVVFLNPEQAQGDLKQDGVALLIDITAPAILNMPSCSSAAGRR